MYAEMKIPDTLAQKCNRCGKPLVGEAYRVDRGEFSMPNSKSQALAHFLEEFRVEERIGYYCPDCWERETKFSAL